jgi:hypothetical protein
MLVWFRTSLKTDWSRGPSASWLWQNCKETWQRSREDTISLDHKHKTKNEISIIWLNVIKTIMSHTWSFHCSDGENVSFGSRVQGPQSWLPTSRIAGCPSEARGTADWGLKEAAARHVFRAIRSWMRALSLSPDQFTPWTHMSVSESVWPSLCTVPAFQGWCPCCGRNAGCQCTWGEVRPAVSPHVGD